MGAFRPGYFLWIPFLLLCQPGCSARAAKVSGTVVYNDTINDYPLIWGTVNLMSEDQKPYQGQIQPDGTYVINGVPFGKYAVMIHSPEPNPAAADARKKKLSPQIEKKIKEKAEFRNKWFAIPERYSDFTQSGLVLKVEQANTTFDIKLTE